MSEVRREGAWGSGQRGEMRREGAWGIRAARRDERDEEGGGSGQLGEMSEMSEMRREEGLEMRRLRDRSEVGLEMISLREVTHGLRPWKCKSTRLSQVPLP